MAAWIEQTWIASLVRETAWGFPFALILHAIGMGFVAGFDFALGARLLGVAPGIRPPAFAQFLPLVRANLVVVVVSGIMLLSAFPARVLANPIFYLKMLLLVVAIVLTRRLCRICASWGAQVAGRVPAGAKRLALVTMIFWVAVIVAGRLLPYTHDRFITSGG